MPVQSDSPDADIFEMVARGDLVYAVAAYRARYHVAMDDAHAAVQAMAAIVRTDARPAATAAPAVATAAPAASPGSDVDAEVLALVAQNQKLPAIKRYMTVYGVGLAQAKNAVDALVDARSNVPFVTPDDGGASEGLIAAAPEIDQLILSGNLIGAIKRYREVGGVGLREAKDAVEARAAQLRR